MCAVISVAPHAMSPRPPELWRLSAHQLAKAVRQGDIAAATVRDAHLARIAALEPVVRAWAWHSPPSLQNEEARPRLGLGDALLGVPYGIKDIFNTVGMPTSLGNEQAVRYTVGPEARVITLLRAAGAVLFGKTVTAELAFAHAGPTRNPRDPRRSPGGSSSGSAAAVAAGMVPFAIGSQSGGSTIRPAAYCGVVGFKPTYGLCSVEGMMQLAPSLDTVGIHARSVDDVALVTEVLTGSNLEIRPPVPSRSLRIGFFPGPHRAQASVASQQALSLVASIIKDADVDFVDVDWPGTDFVSLSQATQTIMAYEAVLSLRKMRLDKSLLHPKTIGLLDRGRNTSRRYYQCARDLVERCKYQIATLMQGYDAWLTFSAPDIAPLFEEGLGDSLFNRAWTAMGGPCISLPMPVTFDALPLGIQLIAAPSADERLLVAALRIETLLRPATKS